MKWVFSLAVAITPGAQSAVAARADGLIIEVQNDPENALTAGARFITPNNSAT